MTAQPIRLHASTHLPDGQDPLDISVFDAIRFNTYPQDGRWLYVKTTLSRDGVEGIHLEAATSDPEAHGRIYLKAGREILTDSNRILMTTVDNVGAVDPRDVISITQTGTGFIQIGATGQFDLSSVDVMTLRSGTGVDVTVEGDGDLRLNLNAVVGAPVTGRGLIVSDNSTLLLGELLSVVFNGSIYEYHIKTGATWIADL